MKTSTQKILFSPNQKAIYAAVISSLAMMNANAATLPTNPHVVYGGVTFTLNGNTLTIANSPNSIINWGSFDLGKDAAVIFKQLSSSSAVLNRDTSGNPSEILGSLSSNGKVFLINPAGVIFGVGSQIDTAGLIASSLNITNQDFLQGKLNFNASQLNTGAVINNGSLNTTKGGFVYLIAPNVENNGIIKTPSGETILAAGNSVEIVNSTDPSQRVLVSATSKDVNLSQAITESGNNIFKVLNSGKIQANSAVVGKNGKVYLRSGGDIETTADSKIEANGGSSTNGGLIQALAADQGMYFGSMVASGKNGGFIETSANFLDVNSLSISTKALSLQGKDGNWLIDPANIEIATSGSNSCGSGGSFSCTTDTSVILVSTLLTALNSSNVTIDTATCTSCTAAGDITVNAAINSASTRSLTMTADGSITVNNSISIGGDLAMAANGGTFTGNASMTAASVDLYAQGDINLNALVKATKTSSLSPINIESQIGDVNINGGLNSTVAADMSITAGSNVNINSAIKTAGGDISLTADSSGSGSGTVNIGSTSNTTAFVVDAGVGTVNISGANANIINAGITSKNFYADITNTLTVGDATAILPSFISTSTYQEISASNIYVKAGTGQTVSSLYNSAEAYLLSKGDQKISVTNGLELDGNNTGTNNYAKIAIQGSGTQSIDSDYYLTLHAGNANGANATIDGGTGSQDINSVYIDIYAGAANDSSAGIATGADSTITATSSISLTGGNSSSTNISDFSAAYIGSKTQAVNLTLNAGSLYMNGGLVSGANPGALIGAIGKNATITMNINGSASFDASGTSNPTGVLVGTTTGKSIIQVNAADFNVTGGSTGTAVIGSKSASTGSSLEINTSDGITIGNNSIIGFTTSTGASTGTVTLDADNISSTGIVYANSLIASADNGISLVGLNKVNTVEATNNSTGDIHFEDTSDLTISSHGVFNYASDGSMYVSSTGLIKTGTGDGIQNLGSGAGSFVLQGDGGITIQDGSLVNNSTGLTQLNADGDISIGAGGIISSGDVSLYATNIKGSGLIDLAGINTANLYASNNIGTVTKAGNTTTYTPVNITAGHINANAGGTRIIVANYSDGLSSASMNGTGAPPMSTSNLTDAVLFNYKDLNSTYINSDAANLSIVGKSGNLTYTSLYVSGKDVLISGSGLNINSSQIYSNSVAVIASNLSLKDSYLNANSITGDISLFGNSIKLDSTELFSSNNIYFNANASSFNNLPGSSELSSLLNFASNSTITIDNRSFVYANNDVDFLAGTLNVKSSGIQSGHDVLAAVKNNLNINGGDGGEGSYIYASDEVRLAVGGNLVLNSSTDTTGDAQISAGSSDTIYLDLPLQGKYIVDGKTGATTSTKNSSTGFFVNGSAAVVGDTLEIRNGTTKTTTETKEIEPVRTVTNDILNSTKEKTTDKDSSNKLSNSKADDDFFGNKDNKNSNKKSQPKQCS